MISRLTESATDMYLWTWHRTGLCDVTHRLHRQVTHCPHWPLSTGDIQTQDAGVCPLDRHFGVGVLTAIQLVHDRDEELCLHIILSYLNPVHVYDLYVTVMNTVIESDNLQTAFSRSRRV